MNNSQLPEREIEQQKEKTLAALEEYKQAKYGDVEIESLPQLLYSLFDNIHFEDRLHYYQENLVLLLSLLSRPAVVDILRSTLTPMEQEDISRMLVNLYRFFRCLDAEEYYSLLMKTVEVELTDDPERLKAVQRTYSAKLAGLKAEREAEKKGEGASKIDNMVTHG